MIFRNLSIIALHGDIPVSAEALNDQLESAVFRDRERMEIVRRGFAPIFSEGEVLAHSADGCYLMRLCEESALLPAAVLRQALTERVAKIESQEKRRVPKRERDQIQEELVFDMLPKAFSQFKDTWAYIDTRRNLLVIDSASAKAVDTFVSILRSACPDLGFSLLEYDQPVDQRMGKWLRRALAPGVWELENEVQIAEPEANGSKIAAKRHDVTEQWVLDRLSTGHRVTQLALSSGERVSFVLDEQARMRRVKMLDAAHEDRGDLDTEDEREKLDSDFVWMHREFGLLIDQLFDALDARVPKKPAEAA